MCTCITLYNLIHRKYKAFVTCMCILLLSCLFCYKVSDSKKKKIVKAVSYHVWMSIAVY